jgi:hypothetical protein
LYNGKAHESTMTTWTEAVELVPGLHKSDLGSKSRVGRILCWGGTRKLVPEGEESQCCRISKAKIKDTACESLPSRPRSEGRWRWGGGGPTDVVEIEPLDANYVRLSKRHMHGVVLMTESFTVLYHQQSRCTDRKGKHWARRYDERRASTQGV